MVHVPTTRDFGNFGKMEKQSLNERVHFFSFGQHNNTSSNNDNMHKNKKISNIILPPPIPPPRSLFDHPPSHPISASDIHHQYQQKMKNQNQNHNHLQNQNQNQYHNSHHRQTTNQQQQQQQQQPQLSSTIIDDVNGGIDKNEKDKDNKNNNNNNDNDHVVKNNDDDPDPHDIYSRFVVNQLLMYGRAINEIRQGQKRSCWFWFVLPCSPYVVDGIERGSSMNQHFALRGDDAVIAFLNYNNNNDTTKKINLRSNYIEIVMTIIQQLQYGNTLLNIFGPLDDVKAISSFQLFHRIAIKINDQELEYVTNRVLELANTKTTKKKTNKKGRPIKWGIL